MHYDVEVIRKKDKVFAEAVDEGMLWVVVLAVVLQMYPELVELWTVSRNTQGHIQRPADEITGLSKLQTSESAVLRVAVEPDAQVKVTLPILVNTKKIPLTGRLLWSFIFKEPEKEQGKTPKVPEAVDGLDEWKGTLLAGSEGTPAANKTNKRKRD